MESYMVILWFKRFNNKKNNIDCIMGKYRIKNLTNELGKRDADYNKQISFQIKNGLFKKDVVINAGDELYIELKMLPLDLQRLRIKRLVSVTEIGNLEYNSKIKELNKKPKQKSVDIIVDTVNELIVEDVKSNKNKKDKNS